MCDSYRAQLATKQEDHLTMFTSGFHRKFMAGYLEEEDVAG